ncbi:MAG: hypothetical protein V4501_05175 [Pseudomonadota bacterium]
MKTSAQSKKQNIPHMLHNQAKTSLVNNLLKQLGKLFTNLTSLPALIQLEIMGIGSFAFATLANAAKVDETNYFTFTDSQNITNYLFKMNIMKDSTPYNLLSVVADAQNICNGSIATQVAAAPEGYTDLDSGCVDTDYDQNYVAKIQLLRSMYNASQKIFEDCLESLIDKKCYNSDKPIMMSLLLFVLILWVCGISWVAYKDCQRYMRRHDDNHIPEPIQHVPFFYGNELPVIHEDVEEDVVNLDEFFEGRRQREGYPNIGPLRLLSITTGRSPREGIPSSSVMVNSPHSQLFLPSPQIPPSAPASASPGAPTPKSGDSERGGKSLMRKASGHRT